jgi:hypothetical protein
MGDHSGNIYGLRPVSVVRALPQIKDHRLFQLKLEDGTTWESFGHQPGQFIEVSVLARGRRRSASPRRRRGRIPSNCACAAPAP